MKPFDLQILRALDMQPAGAPSSTGVTIRQLRVHLPRGRCYDSVREHLAAMAKADTPLVWRRKAGRNWLYRISHAGIEELAQAKAAVR